MLCPGRPFRRHSPVQGGVPVTAVCGAPGVSAVGPSLQQSTRPLTPPEPLTVKRTAAVPQALKVYARRLAGRLQQLGQSSASVSDHRVAARHVAKGRPDGSWRDPSRRGPGNPMDREPNRVLLQHLRDRRRGRCTSATNSPPDRSSAGQPSTTALIRSNVLRMSRTLRRVRSWPPKRPHTVLNRPSVIRKDSVTSVPPSVGVKR